MYQIVEKKQKGKNLVVINATESDYKPEKSVQDITRMVMLDMQTGRRILENPYNEFNRRSVLQEIDVNQKAFNSYVPPRSEDPDESWRAQTVRPVTRNKLISIAAHVTASIIYPEVFAQNKDDQEDKDAALVMRDLIEWTINNSQYSRKFLQAVVAALTDPVAIFKVEYTEVMRKVKEMKEDGTYTVKEMVDEVMSGFTFNIIQANEFYIANAYETDIQRQRFVATRKYRDYMDAALMYQQHATWKHVSPGVRVIFDGESERFYNRAEEDMKGYLVEEVIYYNRALDLELTFINGVLMCSADYPIQRLDKKYPFAKFGYEFINNGEFFYYKSAANKLSSDQELIDTMYNMVMDGTFLALMPPMALYGSEEVNSSVTIPGQVTSFQDPNTRLESIGPRSDLRAGLEAIGMIEKSMSESSQDSSRQGLAEDGDQTAYQVSQREKNARIVLGLFGKMIGFFVVDVGNLLTGDIVQYMTLGSVEKVVNGTGLMKFRAFLLPDKIVSGKKVTKKIQFTDEYYNKPEGFTEPELMQESIKLAEEGGGVDMKVSIAKVNPELFRNLKWMIYTSPEAMEPRSKSMEKALELEKYDRLIQNPTIDQEVVTRDLIELYAPGESDKYIRKQQPMDQAMLAQQGQQGVMANTPNKQKGVNTNLVNQITGDGSLKRMLQ